MDKFEEIRTMPEWGIEEEKWCVEEIDRLRNVLRQVKKEILAKTRKYKKHYMVILSTELVKEMQQALKERRYEC